MSNITSIFHFYIRFTPLGGPEICGDKSLDTSYEIDVSNTTKKAFEVSACGLNPQPSITWMFDGINSMGTTTYITPYQKSFQYNHTFVVEDCGKNLSYEITGYDGNNPLKKSAGFYLKCK